MSIQDLQAQMAAAIAKNDVGTMEAIASQIVAGKKERAKVEADKLLKEAEQLAGKREETQVALFKVIADLNIDGKLRAVKAKGFSYFIKTSYTVPGQPEVHQQASCGLILVTAPKTKRAGGTGASGKSKDEYGLSLSEIVAKFATAEEQAEIDMAETNSKSWQKKLVVKKRAIAEGLLPPVK